MHGGAVFEQDRVKIQVHMKEYRVGSRQGSNREFEILLYYREIS